MRCLGCGSQAVTERPERTAQGYRRFRCRACGKQFNERSSTLLNRTQYPSDVIALVVLWRLRYKLSLRDLPEMFAVRGIVFSHEAVREWEAKLTPALAEALRRRRRGTVGRSWYVDETYLKVHGRWCYWTSLLGVALPHFWWSSRPAGCSNILECRAFVDFSRRPDRELAAGGRAAQNCVCFQRDHSSRTNSFPPKVRESLLCAGLCGVEGSVRNP